MRYSSLVTVAEATRIRDTLLRNLQGEVGGEYIAGLQERFGMSVYDAAFNRAVGAETTGR